MNERVSGFAGQANGDTVELHDVHLSFGEHKVLRGVSLKVDRGETLCIVGGSGVGKSTILRLILRLILPDSGRVLVMGRDICRAPLTEVFELRQQIGMVFQGGALFDSMSVHDNVAFPLYEHTAMGEEAIGTRVDEVLRFVNLDPQRVRELLPAELSGGMRKRVGIARAIVHEPPILLFDEPTSGLDPATTKTIDYLILKLSAELGVCAVIVTHDIGSARRVADRVALVRDGLIAAEDEPEKLFRSDDPYVRAFTGEARESSTSVPREELS